jgi:hypothetical protein
MLVFWENTNMHDNTIIQSNCMIQIEITLDIQQVTTEK